jgi:tetratricopeptide (TPR) repeat protein
MKTQVDFRNFIEAGTKAYQDGEYTEGGKIFLNALKEAKRVHLQDSRLTVILYNLAHFYFQQKRYRKAEALLERALAHCESLFGRNCDHVSRILNRIADVQLIEQKYSRAEALYKRSLQIDRRLLAADDPQIAKQLLKLAWLNSIQNNFEEAHTNLKEALEIKVQNARTQRKFAKAQNNESFEIEDELQDELVDTDDAEGIYASTNFSVVS